MKKRAFINFYEKFSCIHQEIVNELVDMFKKNNVERVNIYNEESPLILLIEDEWSESAYNRTIDSVGLSVSDSGMVDIKLYHNNGSHDVFFGLDDCADGRAILYVYEYVYQHFYSVEE